VSGFAKAVVLTSMEAATIRTKRTSKGQITLPSAIRKQLGLTAGDQLSVTLLDAETIVLKRRVSRPISALRGLLPKPVKALTVQQMDAGVSAYLTSKQAVKAALETNLLVRLLMNPCKSRSARHHRVAGRCPSFRSIASSASAPSCECRWRHGRDLQFVRTTTAE
jgi:antitoxin PrlF